MKFANSVYVAACLLMGVSDAYPNILAHLEKQGNVRSAAPVARSTVPFDAASQLVDTTGSHAFVPPGPGDQRGPCPGLNAMANHGYIPHNGVALITDFLAACPLVFGMGLDLTTVLTLVGDAANGNGLMFSIGGPTSLVPSISLLGTFTGLSGSHNKFEGDGSPTRCDLYEDGNAYLLKMENFQGLYDLGKADDNYDMALLTEYRATRFQQNVAQNPYFFNSPLSGLVAQPGAWAFIYNFMSNKSAEYPEGRLNGEVLKSFYAITGEDGNFTYTPGYERIPDNWYKRNAADEYTMVSLVTDAAKMILAYPEFASVGGNTGTVNSFTGIDLANLTDGVFNLATLTEGNNAMCFVTQITVEILTEFVKPLVLDVLDILDDLTSSLTSASDSLFCPQLRSIDKSQFSNYPGYAKLNDDGTY